MSNSDIFIREIELDSCDQVLKLHQQTVGGVNCVVWDAAIVLVKYLDITNQKQINFLKGKKILELGAGLGCAGIAAACFGADVLLTDLESAQPLLNKNIKANEKEWKSAGGSARAQVLDWDSPTDLDFHPEIVLVTDCVYYEQSLEKLLQLFEKLCKNGKTQILLSQEERDTPQQIPIWQKFMTELNQRFKVVPIPSSMQHPTYSSPEIHLMDIRKL